MPTGGTALIDSFETSCRIINITRVQSCKSADSDGKCFAKRQIYGGTRTVSQTVTVVHTTCTHLYTATKALGGGLTRHIFYEPAQARRAVERALRAAQHLYAFQVT